MASGSALRAFFFSVFVFALCVNVGASTQTIQETKQEETKQEETKQEEPKQEKTKPETNTEIVKDQAPPAKAEPKVGKASNLHSSRLLPITTRAWVSMSNAGELDDLFKKTQIGQLAETPDLKPFFDEVKKQFRTFLDDKNLKAGIKIDDLLDVRSGEICIAGVLQDLDGAQPARAAHGMVILADVTSNEAKVDEILDQVNKEAAKTRGATVEMVDMVGLKVKKVSAVNEKRIRQTRNSFQVVHKGWLLVCDNEDIFRDVVGRIAAPEKINNSMTLSESASFIKIQKETELFGADAHLSWYMDPYGYIKLSQKLYEQEQEIRDHHTDWASILQDVGFDAVKGMGGNVGLAVKAKDIDCEILARTFISAPKTELTEKQKRFFDLFDFNDRKNGATEPSDLISDNAGGFFGGSWEFKKLLSGIGHVYDSYQGGKAGEFDRLLDDLKTDPDLQVDARRIVSMTDNQMQMFSSSVLPVAPESERAAILVPLNSTADIKYIMGSIKRAAKGKEINLGGKTVIEVDTTVEPEEVEDLGVPGADDGFGGQEEEAQPKFNLFQKRYFAIQNNVLIVANDKQYIRQLLGTVPAKKLKDAEDYIRVKKTLEAMTDPQMVSFRRFIRLDKALAINYESIRKGEMGTSGTILGKIINQVTSPKGKDKPAEPRKQKLDGSKLPAEYNKSVAPYLGPSGWVTEANEEGWRITGCLLKK